MNTVNTKNRIMDSRPLRLFFAQSGFTTAFSYLTSGVFLTGLAILMGAGDVLGSYLSVIVNICGVVILIFAPFLERFQSRKRLAIILTALSRLTTLFIVMIPALVSGKLQLVLFVPTVIAAFALQAQTTVVVNQWMFGFMDPAYWDFFSEGKPAFVPIRYLSVRDAITLLHSAGGIAVLAHPGQNLMPGDGLLPIILSDGIDGIEVFSSYHSRETDAWYLQIAEQNRLLVTCGSDFHGKHKPRIRLGGHGAVLSDQQLGSDIEKRLSGQI